MTEVENFLRFTEEQLRSEREQWERRAVGQTLRRLAAEGEAQFVETLSVDPAVYDIVRALGPDATDEEIFHAVKLWGPGR